MEAYDVQLQSVVTDGRDIPETERLVERARDAAAVPVRDEDVPLMPEGATRGRLDETRERVANLAVGYGYRHTPRLHVDVWDDAPGT